MPEPHMDALDGRALDAQVARHLFGLEVEQRQNARTGETDFVCREPGESWNRVPYFGSLGASVKLELRLAERGWKVQPSPHGRAPGPSGLVLVTLTNGSAEVTGTGTSFELALCRAALKALAQ